MPPPPQCPTHEGRTLLTAPGDHQRVCVSTLSRSVRSTLRPHGLEPARLLCPWDSPGKNPGVDCHVLLQGIFPTQWSNPCLLCLLSRQANSLPLSHLRSLIISGMILTSRIITIAIYWLPSKCLALHKYLVFLYTFLSFNIQHPFR